MRFFGYSQPVKNKDIHRPNYNYKICQTGETPKK